MWRFTFRQKKRWVGKLQKLKPGRARNSACTSWWAGYRNSIIRGWVLHKFWLLELTREKNVRAFSFRGLQCLFWQLYLPSYWEDLFAAAPWGLYLINVNSVWSFPPRHWSSLRPVQVGQPQDGLVTLLIVQRPSELQEITCLNTDCKGEDSCWDVGARSVNNHQKFWGRFSYLSFIQLHCCCVEVLVLPQKLKFSLFCS